MTTPTLLRFDTETALEEYLEEELNCKGREPTLALLDSDGTHTTAHRTAPGGEGYALEYAVGDRDPDTGGRHCCNCAACPPELCTNLLGPWAPRFPVWTLALGDRP